MAEWTADQLKMAALQRELSGLFELISIKDVPMPPDSVLMDYTKLCRYRDQVASGDVAKNKQHTHGWRKG